MACALAQNGISYEHRRDLGTPPEITLQRRVSGHDELAEYARCLDDHSDAVARAAESLTGQAVAIVCYEREPHLRHRSLVADRLATLTGARIELLM